ncbi:hypothetical protein ARALYDRAFT_918529 [Arabidopsis lyrata subsp. lyrata]|uniref:Uncharacterized protein n=1 Tax=Arabidopsis lyrata subsp. lyrata TaxID=81972 RepID=D7MTQ1_ARALL|nr:hypothetical protein ARALYDRAFT_918529 [Arabidopsis lyrata subsp. lyrata]
METRTQDMRAKTNKTLPLDYKIVTKYLGLQNLYIFGGASLGLPSLYLWPALYAVCDKPAPCAEWTISTSHCNAYDSTSWNLCRTK